MKKLAKALGLLAVLVAIPVFAHHAAEGIVDAEVYVMIDEIVSDTPHGDLLITDLGGGMTEMTVIDPNLNGLEDMVEAGLFKYAMMLSGEVNISIDIDERGDIVLSILHIADELKTKIDPEMTTWGDVKAGYK